MVHFLFYIILTAHFCKDRGFLNPMRLCSWHHRECKGGACFRGHEHIVVSFKSVPSQDQPQSSYKNRRYIDKDLVMKEDIFLFCWVKLFLKKKYFSHIWRYNLIRTLCTEIWCDECGIQSMHESRLIVHIVYFKIFHNCDSDRDFPLYGFYNAFLYYVT